jgi:predicted MFS family arabinose efflux permease
VLVAANLGTVAGIFPAFLVGAIAVQAGAELGFAERQLGALLAVPFLAAALTSTVSGRRVERSGPARSLRFTSVAAAAVMLGLASVRSVPELAVGLAAAGALNAMAQPAANLLVARGIDPRRQGLAFGLKQSAMPGATLLAGFTVPVIALTVGWRWAFVAGSAMAVAAAVVMPSEPAPRPTRATRNGPRARPDAPLSALVVLACGVGLCAASAGALAGFLVSAGVHSGLREADAGWLLMGGSAVGIVARITLGARADGRTGGQLRLVAGLLVGGAAAFALLSRSDSAALLLATPLAFGLGWSWPGLFNFSVVRNNPSAPAAATGVTQTGTYLGAMAGPLIFGWVVDTWSYQQAWLLGSCWYLAGAAAMLLGRHLLRRAVAGAPEPTGTTRPRPGRAVA